MILPVVMLMLMGILQAGLWWWGRQSALSAAQQGLQAAQGGNAVQATALAHHVATEMGGLRGVAVNVSGGELVDVAVSGSVSSLVPGMPIQVKEHAVGPRGGYVAP